MWNPDTRVEHLLFIIYSLSIVSLSTNSGGKEIKSVFSKGWWTLLCTRSSPSFLQLLIWDRGFPVPGQGKCRPLRDEAGVTLSQSEAADNVRSANQRPGREERLIRVLKGEWRLEWGCAGGIFSSFNVTLIYLLELLEDYLILMMATLLAKKFQQKLNVFNFSILDIPGGFYVLCSRFTLSASVRCATTRETEDPLQYSFTTIKKCTLAGWLKSVGWT